MQRPDAQAEIVRRNNAAARLKTKAIVIAGLDDNAQGAFDDFFPKETTYQISVLDDLYKVPLGCQKKKKVLSWGRDRIGLGLLLAHRARQQIVFTDAPSECRVIPSSSGHLVVCEEGNELAQVIAANYAYSFGAGLCLIPQVQEKESDRILEDFYSLYDDRQCSPTTALEYLRDTIRQHAGALPIDSHRSVTFITSDLPWGFAYPEKPSTHLFMYPDLGISILNGVLSEQRGAPGIGVAAVVDPGEVEAKEVKFAMKTLAARRVFVKGIIGKSATVYNVSRFIELYPYDFLLISTHCGDAPGWRWTYEFVDSEGLNRKLVVDLTIGVAVVPGDEKLNVTQFTKFVSLDDVDWNDPEKKSKLYVGKALIDYVERTKGNNEMKPVKKEEIDRVPGSAALKMYDGNYISFPRSLADHGAPIVLNNACASWHRLAQSFAFGNSRAYIGTLFSVSDVEAQEVAIRLLDRHFGKPLAVALWHAQNDIYQDSVRRPYVLVGPHFQRFRTTIQDAPVVILNKLQRAYRAWERRLKDVDPSDEQKYRSHKDYMRFLNKMIEGIHKRWIAPRTRGSK